MDWPYPLQCRTHSHAHEDLHGVLMHQQMNNRSRLSYTVGASLMRDLVGVLIAGLVHAWVKGC